MNKLISTPAFYLIPKAMRIPFWFFLLFGIYLIIDSGDLSYLLLIIISLVIITLKNGYQFSFQNKNKFKSYWSILFCKFGKWKVLPDETGFMVSKANSSVTLVSRSNQKLTLDKSGFMVYMVQSKKMAIAFYKEKNEANNLADMLNISMKRGK